MKNIYKKYTYEDYIILLYLYVYYKREHMSTLSLNGKLLTHYIKLYNLIYISNLKPSFIKNLINLNNSI